MATTRLLSTPGRVIAGFTLFVTATVLLTALAVRFLDPHKVSPDFLQFWTAATLLARGQDPYDPALQSSIQQTLGWTKTADGLGIYEFLPYYYPPWLALAFRPFLLLDYGVAKLTWMVLSGEFLVLAAILLRDRVRSLPSVLVFAVVLFFGFSIRAAAMGQVAPLVLLLTATAWTLLDTRRDLGAGAALAMLTTKPQITLPLVGAVLAWSLLRRRWSVSVGFAAAFATLCAASTLAFPRWPVSMLNATRATPMLTEFFPGVGVTWMSVLGGLGVSGVPMAVAVAFVGVAVLVELGRLVLSGGRIDDIFAVSLLTPFFLVPYARCYDLPVILVPAFVAMGTRMTWPMRLGTAGALTVLVGEHILTVIAVPTTQVAGQRRLEFTYFWIPLLVAALWWVYARKPAGGAFDAKAPVAPDPT